MVTACITGIALTQTRENILHYGSFPGRNPEVVRLRCVVMQIQATSRRGDVRSVAGYSGRLVKKDKLDSAFSLLIFASVIETLVVAGTYLSGVLKHPRLVTPHTAAIVVIGLATLVALAGLLTYAVMKGQKNEHIDHSAQKDPSRTALAVALGGMVFASLVTHGIYWYNISITASATAASNWVAGVFLLVAAVAAVASVVVASLTPGKELDRSAAQDDSLEGQNLQARFASADRDGQAQTPNSVLAVSDVSAEESLRVSYEQQRSIA